MDISIIVNESNTALIDNIKFYYINEFKANKLNVNAGKIDYFNENTDLDIILSFYKSAIQLGLKPEEIIDDNKTGLFDQIVAIQKGFTDSTKWALLDDYRGERGYGNFSAIFGIVKSMDQYGLTKKTILSADAKGVINFIYKYFPLYDYIYAAMGALYRINEKNIDIQDLNGEELFSLLEEYLEKSNDTFYHRTYIRGEYFYNIGDYSNAIIHYNEFFNLLPTLHSNYSHKDRILYKIYRNRGISNMKLGNYQQAVDDFIEAIGQFNNPSSSYFYDVYVMQAECYEKMNNYQYAIDIYKNIINMKSYDKDEVKEQDLLDKIRSLEMKI